MSPPESISALDSFVVSPSDRAGGRGRGKREEDGKEEKAAMREKHENGTALHWVKKDRAAKRREEGRRLQRGEWKGKETDVASKWQLDLARSLTRPPRLLPHAQGHFSMRLSLLFRSVSSCVYVRSEIISIIRLIRIITNIKLQNTDNINILADTPSMSVEMHFNIIRRENLK